ncbi:MAG TPA: hypothetical protein VFM55_01670 [Micromonosporaceae bacterium]|nr:hypothetical protein [Micromonosporaceae bacterium]
MPRATTTPANTPHALSAAACLLATAALARAASTAPVRVLVAGGDIDVQVPLTAGDQAARERVVAAYATVLGTEMTRQHSPTRNQAWVQALGRLGGHRVHVWTITDPAGEA